jgi:hypothetical protein
MEQKIEMWAAAILGVIVVLILALAGIDFLRVSRTGPGWKRKIITAGIFLLAGFGLISAGQILTKSPAAFADVNPDKKVKGERLLETAEWKRLESVWKEAHEIASGERGMYPFDEKGKKKILSELEESKSDIARLWKSGFLSKVESELLTTGIVILYEGVASKRPTEMKRATCYLPVNMGYRTKKSLDRLSERLPLIEKFAAAEIIQPAVASKVVATIEEDLKNLDEEAERIYSGKDKEKIRTTREAAQKLIKKIQERMKAGGRHTGVDSPGEAPPRI